MMSTAAAFRVPGVIFVPSQRAQRPELPALDVAAFVGFAERGPLHVPVMVEDDNVYQRVFGGDQPLAQELGGRVVNAGLPRAIQAFFANGGRRCYAVRVAGPRASAARLRVPGLVAWGGPSGAKLAGVSASSPGSWGAQLRLAARLNVIPVEAAAFELDEAVNGLPDLIVRPQALDHIRWSSLSSGDVLRLQNWDGSSWLAVIKTVQRETLSPFVTQLSETRLLRLKILRFFRLLDSLNASPPDLAVSVDLLTITGTEPFGADLQLAQDDEGRSTLMLTESEANRLGAGDILHLQLASAPPDDLGILARVSEIRAIDQETGSPPGFAFSASFAALLHLGHPDDAPSLPLDSSPPEGIRSVELLRMDLLLQYGNARLPVMPGMAFNAPHSFFWGDEVLLESSLIHERASHPLGSRSAANNIADRSENRYSASADWFRAQVEDLYDLAPMSEPRRTGTPLNGFNRTAAFAGLLSPVGSILTLTPEEARAMPNDRDIVQEQYLTFLPLGMPEVINEGDPVQFRPPEPSRPGNDDLENFDASVFYDARLAPLGAPGSLSSIGETQRTLLESAFDLYYVRGLRLRGLHSLLFVDEVALLGLPDAQHRPWRKGDPIAAPAPPRPVLPEPEIDCPTQEDFRACSLPPTVQSVEPYYGSVNEETTAELTGEGFTATAPTKVTFGLRPAENIVVLSSTRIRVNTPPGVRPGPVDISVTNENGTTILTGAYIYTNSSTSLGLPVIEPTAANARVEDEDFLYVQQALLTFCQARGDVLAVFSLPQTYDLEHCLEWQAALRRRLGLPRLEEGFGFDEPQEVADLSFAAVYHPWLLIADRLSSDGTRAIPPEGAICGMIATRERERQVWVAPANLPLRDVIGLDTDFNEDQWAELFAQRFNLIRREATSFRPLSAHTLSGERSLLQISVRRLLILLRKAAVILGMDYVFQTNHEIFREGVRVVLDELLRFLFRRGAFSGQTETESFRVITDQSVNPRTSIDQGRFVAVIQVAPSQPMEFITVRLTRTGEGQLITAEA